MSQRIETPPGYREEPAYRMEGLRGRQTQFGPTRRYDWRHWAHQDLMLWTVLAIAFAPLVWLLCCL